MLMKKILSITIALLMLFSLVSCSSGGDETTTEADNDKVVPVISLVTQKTAVKPGEEIKVTLHISKAPLTACFDVCVYAESMLQYVEVKTIPSQLILAANKEAKGAEEYVIVRGIVAATYDVLDDDICEITYKVSEDAAKGTKINLTTRTPVYQVGMDESGNDVLSVTCETNGLVLEVI